jgi:hypothetical protein
MDLTVDEFVSAHRRCINFLLAGVDWPISWNDRTILSNITKYVLTQEANVHPRTSPDKMVSLVLKRKILLGNLYDYELWKKKGRHL